MFTQASVCDAPAMSRARRTATVLALLAPLLLCGSAASQDATLPDGRILTGQFLALGPFRQPVGCGAAPADLLQSFVAPAAIACEYPVDGSEVDYDSVAAASSGYEGPTSDILLPVWRVFDDGDPDGVQNLAGDFGFQCSSGEDGRCENLLTYLATYVEYTGDAPVEVELCAAIDDGALIWFDDRLVHTRAGCGAATACRDAATITVQPGVHRIALAAFHGVERWTASLSMRDSLSVINDASADWVFHGTEPPDGYTPPDCPDVTLPVGNLTCEPTVDLGVRATWTLPPGSSPTHDLRVAVDGREVRVIPGDRTEVTLTAEEVATLGVARVCIDNPSGIAACCDVAVFEPVEIERCNRTPDGGVEILWVNPFNARVEQSIDIVLGGEVVATRSGVSESATLAPDEIPDVVPDICVVNESGLADCCAPDRVDENGDIRGDDFLVLGPFSFTLGCEGRDLSDWLLGNVIAPSAIRCLHPAEGDSAEYLPGQATSSDYLGPVSQGFEPVWRKLDDGSPQDGHLDLAADFASLGFEGPPDDVVSWLVTYFVYSGPATIEAELCVGYDDGGQVWLDDTRLFNQHQCGLAESCRESIGVRISPGAHRVALASFSSDGPWGARLGIRVGGRAVTSDRTQWPDWELLGTERPQEDVIPCGDGTQEICDNGVDDDADDLVDCDDADCSGEPLCQDGGEGTFLRGDVDGNGLLDITDPISNLGFQFLGEVEFFQESPCFDALDFDDNGAIEITDAIGNLSHQFLGSQPPAPPGATSCGPDPTTDDPLDCERHAACAAP